MFSRMTHKDLIEDLFCCQLKRILQYISKDLLGVLEQVDLQNS